MRAIFVAILMVVSIGLTAQKKDTVMVTQPDTTCLLPDEEALPYEVVDEKPLFNGEKDLVKFQSWIYENIRIPQEYGDISFQGTIVVGLIVNRKGYVCNVEAVRPVDRLLDAEVVRVVKESPRWKPAMHQRENVSVRFFIPVRMKF